MKLNDTKILMPVLLMLAFALTRWPGLLPANFSAAYALVFCAAIYFSGRMAWWLPLGTLLISDVLMNTLYYKTAPIHPYMLVNYLGFTAIFLLGRRFKPNFSWLALLAGGLLGALLFYFITNSAAWLQNPLYPKTLAGWIQALTIGTPGWPHTWEFFRNTLLSGGLFTALFTGVMKAAEALEKEEEEEDEPATKPEETPVPEESKGSV